MRIRLGYVAIALNLPKVTSSSTVTFSNYSKLKSEEDKLKKLKSVTFSNLEDLEKILKYNIENQIHFYRFTSKLIPLSTHPDVTWEYDKYFKKELLKIGRIIKESNMRIDAHPDQFNVINSVKDKVVQDTIRNLNHAVDLFELMNYEEGKLVIHVGSATDGKEESIKRFIDNLNKMPKRISEKLIIENDDKVYTALDVLNLCKAINLPMVLDLHHHKCNNNKEKIEDLINPIFDTWNKEIMPPKVHYSSPREGEFDRKHSDYINVEEFMEFLDMMRKTTDRDFDVMIEAKNKDQALFKLIEDLKNREYDCEILDKSTIIIK